MGKKNLTERKSFSKLQPTAELPNFLELPINSYRNFIQADKEPDEREVQGLEEIFRRYSPIEDTYGRYKLIFQKYEIEKPRFSPKESQKLNFTYGGALYAEYKLIEYEGEKDEEKKFKDARTGKIYLGDLPLITDYGSFIVNGSERIIVNQIHRSPGVTFSEVTRTKNNLPSARVIPLRGSWLRFRLSGRDVAHMYLPSKQKVPVTTILRATGDYSTDEEIVDEFYDLDYYKVKKENIEDLQDTFLSTTVINEEDGSVLAETGKQLTKEDIEKFIDNEIGEIPVADLDIPREIPVIFNSIQSDETKSTTEAQQHIYSLMRPGGTPEPGVAEEVLDKFLFNPRRYDLGRVGRMKINKRLNLDVPLDKTKLTSKDMVEITKYLIGLRHDEGELDDIDHLGLRRVRSVGELFGNSLQVSFSRLSKTARQRMRTLENETIRPKDLLNARTVSSGIESFFGTSRLSQFMDQSNPLAELTHKRRVSALGPGGLTRARAGFEVRDVHHTHYGRLCPVETPEGQNIGLIISLACYAGVNEFGFLTTPYRKVEDGEVTDEIDYITADTEDRHTIAQATVSVGNDDKIQSDSVLSRHQSDIVMEKPENVDYIDVSTNQSIGVSAALIPFLSHDDANRALMGSNMQRQSVPLLHTSRPLVGTGLEPKVAVDSGAVVCSETKGKVTYADANIIKILPEKSEERDEITLQKEDVYELKKFNRSNQDTTINQKPIVKPGEKVEKGDVIADGPATAQGELSLGKDILVAFMPWEGYNFEDALVVSEELVKKDTFTSLHIEEFEVEVRDTKRGREELTSEIPNVSKEDIKELDENSIIRIGAEVESGDILVGKVTPKGEKEYSPEERLLKAIFGEKAGDVKDASLRVPPETSGTVIDVDVLSRKANSPEAKMEDRKKIERLQNEHQQDVKRLKELRDEKIVDLLHNKRAHTIQYEKKDSSEVKAGNKLTKKKLKKINFDKIDLEEPLTEDDDINEEVREIATQVDEKIESMKYDLKTKIDNILRGDELPTGVLKMVKIKVAMKRTLSVGDKIAGRHGNKGVISKIVPVEDMPFMEDGTPIQIVLNPLGVPSRMNIGQILETHLGYAAHEHGQPVKTPVFNGATIKEIQEWMEEADLPTNGKVDLYDGKTGKNFDSEITVGYMHLMKLIHLAEDKSHARSIGPYSLITQQPLGGKSKFGGQRFGEMEVWALEAYGASYTLQEMLTVKSDDVKGRTDFFASIVNGKNPPEPGLPSSFNVLVNELRSLGLDVEVRTSQEAEE